MAKRAKKRFGAGILLKTSWNLSERVMRGIYEIFQ